MKFKCKRADILSAIQKAEKAVIAKSSIPVMEGMLIDILRNGVIITGNDLEIAIEAYFDAEVISTGRIVLNARMFSDIIRKTGGEEVLFEAGDKMNVKITSGLSVFEISGLDPLEFPNTADFELGRKITIGCLVLKQMIRQTYFAASKTDFRQVLTGELFKVGPDGVLTVVALDGHRLAMRKEKLVSFEPVDDFILPFNTLNELLKIVGDEGNIDIYPSGKYIMFEFDNCKIFSRTIHGQYVDYNKIISVESPMKLKANIRKMKGTFERVSPIIYTETVKSPVKINILEDKIVIDCTTVTGKVHDEAPIEKLYGENLEIGFTNQYLLDALSACDDDEAYLEFATPLSPMVITPLEGDRYLYIILPVRLKK